MEMTEATTTVTAATAMTAATATTADTIATADTALGVAPTGPGPRGAAAVASGTTAVSCGTTAASGGTTAASGGATAASALELVERSRADLLQACHSRGIAQRYQHSQLAAMRAAAALVSARAVPTGQARPRSLWDLLPSVAPELTEWAGFFAAVTSRHPSLAGSAPTVPGQITAREADDLLRQAETFVELVCRALGLPMTPVHGDVLVPTGWA